MKKILLVPIVSALFFGFAQVSEAQTKPQAIQSELNGKRPKIIALKPAETEELPYDAGKVRFLATSEDTNGAFSLFELVEMPGYKTAFHRHNSWDEAFYVLEGVLSVRINDKVSDFPAGSYVLIPRGTPHGQGNFGKVPTRVLLTFTPSAYEQFFRDRVDLYKTVKPDSLEFQTKFNELRKKHAKWVDILGTWDAQK